MFVVFTSKMATLGIFFFFFFSTCTATSVSSCLFDTEQLVPIRFPFWLRDSQTQTDNRRGHPAGFNLSRNSRGQAIINFPSSGEFKVQRINYSMQALWINDPDCCLPKRILDLKTLDIPVPFRASSPRNYSFINCSSSDVTDSTSIAQFISIPCLSGHDYTVMAGKSSQYFDNNISLPCIEISTVTVPMGVYEYGSPLGLKLTWDEPNCRSCEGRDGTCGFKNDMDSEILCSINVPSSASGLPRTAKYGIIVGAGIPGLVFIIGLACYVCNRVRAYGRHRHPNNEVSSSITSQPTIVVMGLDGTTIESYPKTVLGESRRLPKPNDGTCPICLSEYQPKETLRTIPECNHYFHALCIDEWLVLNATCPLCRNTPDGSSVVTPCPSSSSSSSSSIVSS